MIEEDNNIDIDSIEELEDYSEDGVDLYDENSIHLNRLKINELVRTVKQLNNKVKK